MVLSPAKAFFYFRILLILSLLFFNGNRINPLSIKLNESITQGLKNCLKKIHTNHKPVFAQGLMVAYSITSLKS